jgi:respiratory nitrate reductase gamma subunit
VGRHPYLCIASFVGGHVWRYRYDKFGWTTRSSQMYERRLLRLASPLFHFGILVAIGGHVIGILIPKSWTEALGIGETAYHAVAVTLGTVAGVATGLGSRLTADQESAGARSVRAVPTRARVSSTASHSAGPRDASAAGKRPSCSLRM